MVDRNLNEFSSDARGPEDRVTDDDYQTITCPTCGESFPRVREACPYCGHEPSNASLSDNNASNSGRTHPDVTVSNPDYWGVGVLVDASAEDLARKFAQIAVDNVKSVSESRTSKIGYRKPEIDLFDDVTAPPVPPIDNADNATTAIPISEGDNEALDLLIDATDWDAREPRPYLFTEYGNPVVDRDRLDTYLAEENPQWLILGSAHAGLHEQDGKVFERVQECGYCEESTPHQFVGRDGSPDVDEGNDLEPAPVWECAECGNYRLGPDPENQNAGPTNGPPGAAREEKPPREHDRPEESPTLT